MKNKLFKGAVAMLAVAILIFACKRDRVITTQNNTSPKSGINMSAQWKSAAPAKQIFTLNASSGGTITGAKGCVFYFSPNSLLDAAGNVVSGNVTIELVEYMKKSDMIFSGVTTTSGNKLLESGGMFYLMAKKGSEELQMKPGVGFGMMIPQTDIGYVGEPMMFWSGKNNQDDTMNKVDWEVADSNALKPVQDTAAGGGVNSFYSLYFNYFKFGFCNIDRDFTKFKTLITKFRIKMPSGCGDSNSTALLLFKNYNSCAWCYWLKDEGKISTGYSLPLGETIKVLIYKKTGKGDDDLEYAIKEITLTDDTEVEFTSTVPCTLLQLEDIIKAL